MIAALIICLTFLTLAFLAKPLVERALAVSERKVAALASPVESRANILSDPMPADILLHAKSFSAQWAQDQVLDRAFELYAQVGDWNKVRSAISNESHDVTLIEVM